MRGACVSIIGAAGESFGFLVFDSVEALESMARFHGGLPEGERPNLGMRIFSANYDRGADIPKSMRREVAKHGWEVVSPDAYPHIAWVDPDCTARPLSDDDVLTGAACAAALARFFADHRGGFDRDANHAVAAEYRLEAAPSPHLEHPEDQREGEVFA